MCQLRSPHRPAPTTCREMRSSGLGERAAMQQHETGSERRMDHVTLADSKSGPETPVIYTAIPDLHCDGAACPCLLTGQELETVDRKCLSYTDIPGLRWNGKTRQCLLIVEALDRWTGNVCHRCRHVRPNAMLGYGLGCTDSGPEMSSLQ